MTEGRALSQTISVTCWVVRRSAVRHWDLIAYSYAA